MDDGSWLSWVIIALLISAASYFAMAETAFSTVSRIKIKTELDKGDYRAKKAIRVIDDFDRAIITIQIGTNIVQMAAAAMVTYLITSKWGVSAVTVSTIVMTLVVFFFAEMLPKSIGKKYSGRLALSLAGSLCFFMKILGPLTSLFSWIGNKAASITKGDAAVTVTEDELYDIIETMQDEGNLGEEKGDLVRSAFVFGEVTAESIATPRVDIISIDINTPVQKVIEFVKFSTHSRFPVYNGSIDNIVGVLQIRKFIKSYIREGELLNIAQVLDSVHFFHQSTKIHELLSEMNRKRINMAVITDNYGGTFGIVTVEDILEELVGDIWDEDDEIEESCVALPDGGFELDPELTVEECFELIDFDDPDDFDFEYKLIGEWAFEHFDNIPSEGDSFEYNGLEITIGEMNNNRILKLLARILPGPRKEGGKRK